jgi:hypothetical protein
MKFETYVPANDSSSGIIMMELKLTVGNAKIWFSLPRILL